MSMPTPGVWAIDTQNRICSTFSHDGVIRAQLVAQCEYQCDAALIAAAPDLLAAQTMGDRLNTPDFLDWIADRLEFVYGENQCVDYMQSLRARANAGRLAITKATGGKS